MFRRPMLLALPVVTLALAACETPTSVTTKGALEAFKPIKGSIADTCETQTQVAEHNSRYDTLRDGKPVVYKAPCAVDQKPAQRVASKR